jgi:hypothetical protein
MEVSSQLSESPGRLTPGIHSIGRSIGPGAGTDAVEKTILSLSEIEPRFLGFQVRSLSLYRLKSNGRGVKIATFR